MSHLKTFFYITFLLATSASYSASFNCSKAATRVEKTICAEKPLSELDDLLAQSYKKLAASVADKNKLKADQLAWLKTRNQCQTSACLSSAYQERIEVINDVLTQTTDDVKEVKNKEIKNVVMGRCHMNSCWWWKVEKTENIQSDSKGKLVKVYARTTSADYSEAEVDKQGYPDFPTAHAQWGAVSEAFVFCAKKLPTYIAYDEEKKQFVGAVPFDQSGSSSGATEGVGNLYAYICNNGKQPTVEISPEAEFSEIILAKPTDIFKYPIK